LNLGACREAQGRSATAWAHYREGLALSRNERNVEGERLALERIAALEPSLCRLVIVGPERGPKGLVVTLDGMPVAHEALGNPTPVDPGTHVVSASAPGGKPWTERVNLVERGAIRVVRVPPLVQAPAPARPVASPRTHDSDQTAGVPAGTVIAGAVGVVGFASTAYFGLRAKSEWETRDEHCPGGVCDEQAVDAANDATTFARIANVSAAVGVVGAGLAIYFALSHESKKTAPPAKAGAAVPLDLRWGKDRIDFSLAGAF